MADDKKKLHEDWDKLLDHLFNKIVKSPENLKLNKERNSQIANQESYNKKGHIS